MQQGPVSLDFIFSQLRYYEDRAREDEETRDTRLGTLVALSGAVLGLLAASLPGGGLCTAGIVVFCLAAACFAAAILVATQFVIRLGGISARFGGRLEQVPELAIEEFDWYLTKPFQEGEPAQLQRRVMPAMSSAIAVRRRNAARKERCQDVTIWLIASGIVAGAAYVAILAI